MLQSPELVIFKLLFPNKMTEYWTYSKEISDFQQRKQPPLGIDNAFMATNHSP